MSNENINFDIISSIPGDITKPILSLEYHVNHLRQILGFKRQLCPAGQVEPAVNVPLLSEWLEANFKNINLRYNSPPPPVVS